MPMEKIALTDTQKYVRDPHSKGLVSADSAGLGAYRNQRRSAQQLQRVTVEINTVQTELTELRKILSDLVSSQACK